MAFDAPPPTEDGFDKQGTASTETDDALKPADFLKLVKQAVAQSSTYQAQVNRNSWQQVYRAFHNEHAFGSKYTSRDYTNRSKIFRSKTRGAVRKHMAAVRATLFGTVDAIQTQPGNEADKDQRAAADIMRELVNYRTDRASGRNALPWFLTAMGACQDSVLTAICVTKQYWKLELRKQGREKVVETDENGVESHIKRDVWVPEFDRPNIMLFPPENIVIDITADWTNPAQSAAYMILKYAMSIDEVKSKQKDPSHPWKAVGDDVLRSASSSKDSDAKAVRQAREGNLDRYDESQLQPQFGIVWVYETFMRVNGEDWCFYSVEDRAMLTDPQPVREVYPEQFGDRPVQIGYGSMESHRIFPMSAADSWQQNQIEINDLTNLTLDAIKQNVMPIPKVRRGRQVDLQSLSRRAAGSAIMVTDPEDVTWDKAPDVQGSMSLMMNRMDLDFDEAAGQMSGQSVQANNSLDRTLGGLKMIAGAANAVQEFDIALWIETWVEPVLGQLVNLEAYYEDDPVILGLCGDRAKLAVKYGINEITNELLEKQVIVRVNQGLANGDPMQRIQKFQAAASIAMPLLQQSPDFMSGKKQIDYEAVMDELFGAVGFRDGGKRFIKDGEPQGPNPAQDAEVQKTQSEIRKNDAGAQASLLTAIAAMKKTANDETQLKVDAIMDFLQLKRADQQQQHENTMGMVDRLQSAGEGDADRSAAAQAQAASAPPSPGPGAAPAPAPMPAPGPAPQGAPLLPPPPPAPANPPSFLGSPPPGLPPVGPGTPQGDQPAAGRAEILAMLQQINQPRERRISVHARDPHGRIAALRIDHLDGSGSQMGHVQRGTDGQIAGVDVTNL